MTRMHSNISSSVIDGNSLKKALIDYKVYVFMHNNSSKSSAGLSNYLTSAFRA